MPLTGQAESAGTFNFASQYFKTQVATMQDSELSMMQKLIPGK